MSNEQQVDPFAKVDRYGLEESFRPTADIYPNNYQARQYLTQAEIKPIKTDFPYKWGPLDPTDIANIITYQRYHEPDKEKDQSQKTTTSSPSGSKSQVKNRSKREIRQALGTTCSMGILCLHDPKVRPRVGEIMNSLRSGTQLAPDTRDLSIFQTQALVELVKNIAVLSDDVSGEAVEQLKKAMGNYYRYDHYQQTNSGFTIHSIEQGLVLEIYPHWLSQNAFDESNRQQYIPVVKRLYPEREWDSVLRFLELPPYHVKYDVPVYMNEEGGKKEAKAHNLYYRLDQRRRRNNEDKVVDYKLYVDPKSSRSKIQMMVESIGISPSYILKVFEAPAQARWELLGLINGDLHEMSYLQLPVPNHFNRDDYTKLCQLRANDLTRAFLDMFGWMSAARKSGIYLKEQPRWRRQGLPSGISKNLRGQSYAPEQMHEFALAAYDKFDSYFGEPKSELKTIPRVDLTRPFVYKPQTLYIRHYCKIPTEARPQELGSGSNFGWSYLP